MNVLYFSNHCSHSAEIISYLKSINCLSIITKFICVDNWQLNGIRMDINHTITKVPILFTPDHNQPLTDETLYHWISYKIKNISKKDNKVVNNDINQIEEEKEENKSYEAINQEDINVDKGNDKGFLPTISIGNIIPSKISITSIPSSIKITSKPTSIDELKAKRESENLSFNNNNNR